MRGRHGLVIAIMLAAGSAFQRGLRKDYVALIGFALLTTGGLLNLTAILLNKGRMPVAGGSEKRLYTPLDSSTRAEILCDRFKVKLPTRKPRFLAFSLGDLICLAGIGVLVCR